MSKNSIDEYLKESVKSYQACLVKNSARRNSLQKKTEGIEMARRKTSNHLEREEKLLRRQLTNMQLNSIRDASSPLLDDKKSTSDIRNRTRKISSITTRELQAQQYTAQRRRRVSMEFEDLTIASSTGKLTLDKKSQKSNYFSPLIQRRGLTDSQTSLISNEELSLVENKSVRRPRKSIQQQQFEKALKSGKI